MADETTPNTSEEETSSAAAGDAKPAKKAPKAAADGAAKPKKEKPPALEDKPFAEFMQQDYLPALKAGLAKQGIAEPDLRFEKRPIAIKGLAQAPDCWQVNGRWVDNSKETREFNLYFFDESINGQKGFSCSENGSQPSTLESFRIDERKADLGLLVFWTVQRLNAQKWLVRN